MNKKSKITDQQNKLKAVLKCPKCLQSWGILYYKFDSVITKDDIKPIIKNKPYYDKEGTLYCSNCGKVYTNMDIYFNIIENLPKKEEYDA